MRNSSGAIVIAVALFSALSVNAQNVKNPDLGSWTVTNIIFSINKKWALWSEQQARSYKFYDQFYYHEVKGGVQYNITSSASAVIGNGQYVTYSPGGNFKNPTLIHEYRLWEQLTLTNNLDRLKLEHRYRVEQRWQTTGFRNRFRYRISAALPLNHEKLVPKTVYLNVFNEIFLTDSKPHFERNRFSVGAGYKFSNNFTLQTAWTNHYEFKATGNSYRINFLQTSLLFNFKAKTTEYKERHPGTMD